MATTSHMKVHIESALTGYTGSKVPSLAGHMWYEVYQRDENGSIVPNSQQSSGYTGHGIDNKDKESYLGEPAYSSKEVPLTQEQYETLFKFGDPENPLAALNGFGPEDYDLFTNSCIDYTWKALELAGFHSGKFEGDLVPMWNQNNIEDLFKEHPHLWNELSDYEKDALQKNGFIPYDPSDPNNFNPNDGNNLNQPSDDDNTNAPDSGNNNNDDNAPEPIKPPPPKDPLILDTNKDGFISTIALSDSNAYFDITGDGIKERVSWIAANDGILVYDKNESGKIDGIDEVFGNFTKNGFEELKELIDSNYDGKIDRQDELFNRLQIWNDLNGDGTTQTNELQSLKDAGVKSIDLNYVDTNITLGGATLTEASKYTDAQNNKELVADVNLEYNPILTTVDTSTIPDYTVDPDTLFLPQLRGYGLIMDSLIAYNTNDALKEKALELQAGGIQAIAEGFEEFSDMWSGYTELIDSMKEKYNVVGDVNLAEIDKRVWILERLTNSPTQTPAIEARLEATLKEHANETLSEALTTQSVILSNQYGLWHVAVNSRDFKIKREVA